MDLHLSPPFESRTLRWARSRRLQAGLHVLCRTRVFENGALEWRTRSLPVKNVLERYGSAGLLPQLLRREQNRIPYRGEGRRVGQIEMLEIF